MSIPLGFLMTAPERPTFALIDHDGQEVTEQSYRGSWMLVYFGFTHCASVCPRALTKLSAALDEAPEVARRVTALYITVDPARDDPARMREYLTRYPRFTGLTGEPDALDRARIEFRVFARRRDDADEPDGYRVPHSAMTYLLGPDGEYVAHFADHLEAADVAARLRALVVGAG